MDFIFNSTDPICRSPVGAVVCPTTINFSFGVSRAFNARQVMLTIKHDEEDNFKEIPLVWQGFNSGFDSYTLSLPFDKIGLYLYYFKVIGFSQTVLVGRDEKGDAKASEQTPCAWQVTVYDKSFTTPHWIKGGVYYHIFVDRFKKSGDVVCKPYGRLHDVWGEMPDYLPDSNGKILNNDYFGGNLRGIIEKLDYLKSLNVSCIYLSPIFEAFSSHKYDTADYMNIDSMFGQNSDFELLCEKAAKMGIRVICDGVFNHVGADSIYFNKYGRYSSVGAYQSKESPYYNWFDFTEFPHEYACWWDFDTLPSTKETEPSFLEFICGEKGIVRHWLNKGASGWRLDVADELPDEFLYALKKAAKTQKSDSLIIGEVWEDASNKISYGKRRHYFEGNQLDSVMNYPLKDALIRYVRYGDEKYIANTLRDITENYPSPALHCLMNILGTHDTSRIVTALAGVDIIENDRARKAATKLDKGQWEKAVQLLKIVSLLQFTLPGVPCIYYGDEAGMEGYNDPFNRMCYPWGKENRELLQWYQKLSDIRVHRSVFREGEYKQLYAEKGVFAFERFDNDMVIYVIVNMGEKPFEIELTREYTDLLTNTPLRHKTTINKYEYLLLE